MGEDRKEEFDREENLKETDIEGTGEEKGKGRAPKEERACTSSLGHAVKSCMTVICKRMGRYLKRDFPGKIIFGKDSFQER